MTASCDSSFEEIVLSTLSPTRPCSARQAIRLGALLVDAGLAALDGKVQG